MLLLSTKQVKDDISGFSEKLTWFKTENSYVMDIATMGLIQEFISAGPSQGKWCAVPMELHLQQMLWDEEK